MGWIARSLTAAAIGLFGGTVQVGAQGTPAALLDAAREDPHSFARYLAQAGVPAGVEIRERDFAVARLEVLPRTPGREISADELVAVFNSSHADYSAAVSGGVVVIGPLSRRSPVLEARAQQGRISVTGLMNALRSVFAPFTPALMTGVAARGGPTSAGIERAEQLRVEIDPGGQTVRDVLNAIANQAPGDVWFVVTRDDEPVTIRRVGFLHADGSTSSMAVSITR